MDKTEFQHADSDSGKSPIGDDKVRHLPLEVVPDPDEGLSVEERKKVVWTAVRLGWRVH